MKYQFIEEWKKEATIAQLCRLLSASRSGYYAAMSRITSASICPITVHLKAEFAASGKSYGSRRLVTALQTSISL